MPNISRRTALAGTAAVVTTLPAGAAEHGHCYALQTPTERLIVDPRQKGEPGDLVVVWRKKRGAGVLPTTAWILTPWRAPGTAAHR